MLASHNSDGKSVNSEASAKSVQNWLTLSYICDLRLANYRQLSGERCQPAAEVQLEYVIGVPLDRKTELMFGFWLSGLQAHKRLMQNTHTRTRTQTNLPLKLANLKASVSLARWFAGRTSVSTNKNRLLNLF